MIPKEELVSKNKRPITINLNGKKKIMQFLFVLLRPIKYFMKVQYNTQVRNWYAIFEYSLRLRKLQRILFINLNLERCIRTALVGAS